MSNFPHASVLSSSLSTSPYAVQSSLENLISRSRTNPNPHRLSQASTHRPLLAPYAEGDATPTPDSVLKSAIADDDDENHAILLGDDAYEDSALLPPVPSSSRRGRASYGTLSTPLGLARSDQERQRLSGAHAGTSRSRSARRSPPRREPILQPEQSPFTSPGASGISLASAPGGISPIGDMRGRENAPRPLAHLERDQGDEEEGLLEEERLAYGVSMGLGGYPGQNGTGHPIEHDPAEELNAQDLELPTGDDGREVMIGRQALKAEIPILLRNAVPAFLTQFAEYSLVIASVISIGHLGTTDLAASSLASMTASVSCFSIIQGLASALDTLLPAAWTSPDPSRVGLWTQRMFVVMAVALLPMMLLWWNVEGILLMLRQEPEVAAQASRYLRALSFGIPGYAGNIIMKKYYNCQGKLHIPTVIIFIVAPINMLTNWALVWGPAPIRMGFIGAPIATAVSFNMLFIMSLAWALMYGPTEAKHPLKASSLFAKLGTVTSLGLAGTIMLSSEWWAWEACALAASLLGPTVLAAQSVLLVTCSTTYQVPMAIAIASAVRVGNLLGAGRGWEAKWAANASMGLSVLTAFLNSALLLIFKNNWGYLFNNDPEVVSLVADILPYVAFFQLTDGLAGTTGSILRSLGLHSTGAVINLTSYYVFGLPLGFWLAFSEHINNGKGLGLKGLWIGLSVALLYASAFSLLLVLRADWVRAVQRVRERLGLGPVEVEGVDAKPDRGEDA